MFKLTKQQKQHNTNTSNTFNNTKKLNKKLQNHKTKSICKTLTLTPELIKKYSK